MHNSENEKSIKARTVAAVTAHQDRVYNPDAQGISAQTPPFDPTCRK